MPRALPLCLIALLAAPAHAGAERGSVAVSLQVLPTCVAKVTKSAKRDEPPRLECSTEPAQGQHLPAPQPAYAVHTYHSANGTVISYDF